MKAARVAAYGCLLLGAIGSAQNKFPLRDGEWEATTQVPGSGNMNQLFCFNDESWMKAMSSRKGCAMQDLTVTSKGAHFVVDCGSKTKMRIPIDITFDGREHMVAKAHLSMDIQGKMTDFDTSTEYHFKNAACDATRDVNLMPRPQRRQ